MIAVITLNPAIDKMCEVKTLKVGEVNRIENIRLIPGGKGINVARALRNLGEDVIVSGFLGKDNSEIFEAEFKSLFMDNHFVMVDGYTRTNTNIKSESAMTEILEPGFSVNSDKIGLFNKEYDTIISGVKAVIISGSICQGAEPSLVKRMIDEANKKGVNVILDTSGDNLKAGLEAKPYFIKPNKRELETLLGLELKDDEIKDKAREVLERYGLGEMVVSLGEDGFIYLDGKNSFKVTGPKIDAISTVGCGDTLVGAYAYSLSGELELDEKLKLMYSASAASALNIKGGVWDENDRKDISKNVVITTI